MSSVKIDDGIMSVKFKSSCPNTATCNMAYWHIVIECTQEEAGTITSVEVYDSGEKVIQK